MAGNRFSCVVGVAAAISSVAVGAAACGSSATTGDGTTSTSLAASAASDAEHRSWVLDETSSGEPGLDGPLVTVFLADGQLQAVLSCNDGGGRYTWDGDHLVTDQVFTTAVGCGDEDAVGPITELLRSRPRVTVEGSRMTMTVDSGTAIAFREIEDDRSVKQTDLVGTFAVLPPDGGSPVATTLTFDANGRYRVRLGCSNLAGQLTVASGRVSHPEIAGALADGCLPSATPVAPDDDLISQALAAAHLRRVDQGLEVLDGAGTRIVLLQPVAGGDPSTTYPPTGPAVP